MINIKCTFFLSSTHDKLDYLTLKLKVKRLVRERRGVQSRQVQVDAHSSRDYHVTHEGQIKKDGCTLTSCAVIPALHWSRNFENAKRTPLRTFKRSTHNLLQIKKFSNLWMVPYYPLNWRLLGRVSILQSSVLIR